MANSVSLANFWPSALMTVVIMGFWLDYAIGARQAFNAHRTRAIFREYIVAMTMVWLTVGAGIALILEYNPPPPQHDPYVIGTIAAMRVILLSVGVWLAWDRRKRHKRRQNQLPH